MMPKVSEIATKNVLQIDINESVASAIKMMGDSGKRSIVVFELIDDKKYFYILTTALLIDLKLSNQSLEVSLKTLDLPPIKSIPSNLNIISLLHDSDHLTEYMVLLEDNELCGIVSYTDVINNVDPKFLLERQTLGKIILQYKAKTAFIHESTLNVILQLKSSEDDAVVVIDGKKPIGIFTTKDFLNIINTGADLSLPVKTYMTAPIDVLHENTTIADAIEYIRIKKFKRIVIVDAIDNLIGVISQKELLRLVYNKWIEIIKEEGDKLSKINEKLLKEKSSLEDKANFDFLTQIYNRQKFESLLEYELKQVLRYKDRSLSIMVLDIDDFKSINDTHGHLVGDEILKEFAKIIAFSIRQNDILARWGGEEFIVMLPHTNIENSFFVAEKLRATIENHTFASNLKITCSIGVSEHHIHQSKDDFFAQADLALYSAKNTGKNKVEMEKLR